MKHFSEEELIAYQLHESSDEAAISSHLERCSECADLSESIAETLRVFSPEPVPQPDLERNWQRLRGNLIVLLRSAVNLFESSASTLDLARTGCCYGRPHST